MIPLHEKIIPSGRNLDTAGVDLWGNYWITPWLKFRGSWALQFNVFVALVWFSAEGTVSPILIGLYCPDDYCSQLIALEDLDINVRGYIRSMSLLKTAKMG